VLVGENGAGKTSVLEAIYFLATTRSFRSSRLIDCLRWQRERFWVRGTIEGKRGDELLASWSSGGARRMVNGKTVALAEYLSRCSAFAWSTRDDPLVDGDPGARRRLLDQGIVSKRPLEVEVLSRYRKVLAAKRRLLTAGRESAPADTLTSWNSLLAGVGFELIALRSAYTRELQSAFEATLRESRIDLPPVDFVYRPNPDLAEGARVEDFLEALEQERSRELRRRRSLLGPHRDRLEIRWGLADIGRSASAGERKLFGLVLTAARRRVLQAGGTEPIILLDDLDATLDGARLEAAWRLFEGTPQVFATSADPQIAGGVSGLQRWRLGSGRIEPN
jgi:DNA replication and repair protein RecF